MKTIKNIDLESKYSEKIQPLFELGREPLMSSAKQANYQEFGLTKEDIPELLKLALDDMYDSIEEEEYKLYEKELDRFYYATIHAVRVLGELKAVEAIEPFLEKLYEDENNEFFSEEMPSFFANIGVEAVEPLVEHIKTRDEIRLILFEAFSNIIKKDPTTEERVSSFLVEYITDKRYTEPTYVAFAISELLDIDGLKYIDAIRESFTIKEVDFMVAGDLEDIEIGLGLREKRDTPVPKNKFQEMSEMIEQGRGEVSYQQVRTEPKIGRNDPCPCGSGKKYKKCCLNK